MMINKLDGNFSFQVPTQRRYAEKHESIQQSGLTTKSPDYQTSISSDATSRLKSENDHSVQNKNVISEMAHGNPETAEKLAYAFAHESDKPLLDISNWAKGEDHIKFSETGQYVNKADLDRFTQKANELLTKKFEIYQSEKIKGTPDADIVDKMIALVEEQSAEYKGIIGWGLRTGAK
ncbi:MAG: hypothetical protein HYZ65_01490 [Burkholderiales bacterium]|nr:hypothetical protein [Burkholderiales bacterium]